MIIKRLLRLRDLRLILFHYYGCFRVFSAKLGSCLENIWANISDAALLSYINFASRSLRSHHSFSFVVVILCAERHENGVFRKSRP
jgi:hypothetical protein